MKNLASWSSLAKVQNTNTVKSMYIWLIVVPIIAKALLQVEEAANVTVFDYSFTIELCLPFSWKVFYFAALCFSISNFIYFVRCYSIIKDHHSFSHFHEEGKGDHQLYDYAKELERKITINNPLIEKLGLGNLSSQEEFWLVFETANMGRVSERKVCAFLCMVGFLLIGIMLFQNLFTVIRMLF